LAFEVQKTSYSGSIREMTLGGAKTLKVGGETAYPFYSFEGAMPNLPKIAMEVLDSEPEEWAAAALEPFKDVASDPVAWAKKCVNDYGAEMICLNMVSTDPNGMNRSAADAAAVAKSVVDAVDVPVIVFGTLNADKDTELLKLVAEQNEGKNLIIGPVQESNHKQVGAPAIGYKHTVVANTPIDVNLAKQLNILLGNLGVPDDKILVDPTVGGIGYGLEYTYSVMERDRMAALVQQDDKLQNPIFCFVSKEVWKTKEAKMGADDPAMGDPAKRGVLMEAMTAATLLLAGANVLVMRHPEAIKLAKALMAELA
jgi:acetyl-CoA decarbonylase/synthase complex subunit delta